MAVVTTQAWGQLDRLGEGVKDRSIFNLFEDPERPQEFSVRADGLLFDYSKTNIDVETRNALVALSEMAGLADKRTAMFAGERINETEGRAVLHTALRAPEGSVIKVDGEDVTAGVHATLARMEAFAEALRCGDLRSPGGTVYSDVVNIGIGGSDLGPAMATRALAPFHDGPRLHYVSNVDSADFTDATQGLDPATTLVIIASKTFTTSETMANAETARAWLASAVGDAAPGHFVALSSDKEKTAEFGIPAERVFGFEDWVGGRYSLWGPIGLGLMLAIGAGNFRAMLAGGHMMDQHFQRAEGAENMPLMLALVGIWHRQVLGYPTRAVLPYEERLSRLPAYLQQLEMESNGKSVVMDGAGLTRPSGPIVWGEPGTNGQHAFYQLIHQGSDVIPCEFMVGRQGVEPELAHQHTMLAANCLAQSEALMRGRDLETARAMMRAQGYTGDALERQARHRVFPGNRPSTTLIYPRLTPYVLGQIIALYEHRVFVEGVILGINSFDQWGVELGKELATSLLPVLQGDMPDEDKDGSTRMLARDLRDVETPVSD